MAFSLPRFQTQPDLAVIPHLAATGVTHLLSGVGHTHMVVQTQRDERTWYKCEECGLMFDSQEDARQHEGSCDAEEPSYIQ